jgi:hypothetical protein
LIVADDNAIYPFCGIDLLSQAELLNRQSSNFGINIKKNCIAVEPWEIQIQMEVCRERDCRKGDRQFES